VAETRCDELTATLIPCPHALLGGKELENSGPKLIPGRKEWWREGVLGFSFYFSLTYSDLLDNELN